MSTQETRFEDQGVIRYFTNDMLVHTEYASGHAKYGEINYFTLGTAPLAL